MKLVAFVDLHASTTMLKRLQQVVKKEKPDAVVCAGDFTIFGQNIEQLLEKIAKLGNVYLIHGNHEDEVECRVLCKKAGIHFVHNKCEDLGGISFVGWGGGGFEERDEEFEAFAKTVTTKKKIVLVTHAPVYGTKTDLIWDDHRGNKSFAKYCKKARVAICGHFHENAGKHDKIGKCLIINPGPAGAVIEIED